MRPLAVARDFVRETQFTVRQQWKVLLPSVTLRSFKANH